MRFKKKATSKDRILNITQSLFALQYWIQKDRCLVLVTSAGSATTGTLELPAFGAHIGPREGRNHGLLNGSSQRSTYQTASSSWRLEMKVHIISVLGVAVGGSRSFSKMPVYLSGLTGSCLQRRQVPLIKQFIQGTSSYKKMSVTMNNQIHTEFVVKLYSCCAHTYLTAERCPVL